MDWTKAFLLAVSAVGSMAAFTLVYRWLSATAGGEPTALSELTRPQGGEAAGLGVLKPGGGPVERLDHFLVRRLGLDRKLDQLHMLLGRPEKPAPLRILHMKELCALVVPAFVYVLTESPVLAALTMAPAFWIPDWYFQGRVAERQRQIIRNFPAMVDLAALTIESGLDYMSAFDRIVKAAAKRSDLEAEVEKMLGEVQLGYSRRDALRRLALRTGLQDIRSFVGLIIQSDELGTSLVDLLRNFSQDMRFRRMNRAEKAAAQASTKMLFPIFFFIFPTVFILMLAPMLTTLFQGGLGF